MTILENLYSEYINGNEAYYEEQKNGEADKSMKQVDATIRQVVYSATVRTRLSDEICEVAYTHEKQGFVHGFRQAMKMAAEIYATENIKNPD